MKIKDRIQLLIAKERLTPSQFADSIDVQRSSISHIVNGRNNPSLDYLQKILTRYPDYDANWLIMGIGDPKSKTKPSIVEHLSMPEIPFDNSKGNNKNNIFTNVNKEIVQPNTEELNHKPLESTINNDILLEDKSDNEPKQVEQVVIFYTDGTFKAYKQG